MQVVGRAVMNTKLQCLPALRSHSYAYSTHNASHDAGAGTPALCGAAAGAMRCAATTAS